MDGFFRQTILLVRSLNNYQTETPKSGKHSSATKDLIDYFQYFRYKENENVVNRRKTMYEVLF